jgi:hypothetical protein
MHLSGLYGLDKKAVARAQGVVQEMGRVGGGGGQALTLRRCWEWLLSRPEEWRPHPSPARRHLQWPPAPDRPDRDEVAAKQVNLTPSTLDEAPKDIYGEVWRMPCAGPLPWREVRDRTPAVGRAAALRRGSRLTGSSPKAPSWSSPTVAPGRPSGSAVKAAVLEQLHASAMSPTIGARVPSPVARMSPATRPSERPLHDHPLFNQDVAQLGNLVWDCITPAIPRAMAFMGALQEIGSWVGERALAWQVGATPGSTESVSPEEFKRRVPDWERGPSARQPSTPLWVIQAKSKASRKQVTMRGFHLPDLVRRLTLMATSTRSTRGRTGRGSWRTLSTRWTLPT